MLSLTIFPEKKQTITKFWIQWEVVLKGEGGNVDMISLISLQKLVENPECEVAPEFCPFLL